MDPKIRKEIMFLKLYAVSLTIALVVAAGTGFAWVNQKPKFDEIDVERINIVEKDGSLKLVISNSARQHPGVIDGRMLSRRRPAGLLFFNDAGDECGGLSFSGNQRGNQGSASGLLAFDRFRQDQTVGIQYGESGGRYSAGLRVWDRPATSLGPVVDRMKEIEKMTDGAEKAAARKALQEASGGVAERVMVGRDRDQTAVVRLSDLKGRPRVKLSVDAAGAPKLEFLDEKGKVTHSLPGDSK